MTRRLLFTSLLFAAILLTVACSGGGPAATPGLTVVAIGRDLSVESTRLPLALLLQSDDGPVRVEDAADRVHVSYGLLDSDAFADASDIEWHAWPLLGGAYVFDPEFDSAGTWEIRAEVDEDGTKHVGSTFITVATSSSSVAIGDSAPRSQTKTGATEEQLRLITSASVPNQALYSMSVSEAVQSGRPTVIAFSTPAFCQTATCGPQVDVVSGLQTRFGQHVNFVHVEVWDNPREMLDSGDPNIGRIAPAVNEWGLITEPWTFLVDADGNVFDKFEAFTTDAELTAAIERMLSTG